MSNARNLSKFKPSSSGLVETADIADDAVSTDQIANDAVISTSGAITTTGAFTSVGIDDNADATTMTIDTSENIGIGNTSPSSQYMTRLVVGDGRGTEGITIYSGNDATGRLEFSDATSGDGRYAGGIVYEHTNNALRFNTNGGNERLRIDSGGDVKVYAGDIFFASSGKGINLGVTSNTDSNTLDDYEEGTWTLDPKGNTTAGSYSATAMTGHYTKIGRIVHVEYRITAGTISSAAGSFQIHGLPFTVGGGDDRRYRAVGSVMIENFNLPDNVLYVVMFVERNNNDAQLRGIVDNAGASTSISVNTDDNFEIFFTVTYPTV